MTDWFTLFCSDGSFVVNTKLWRRMTCTRLASLLDGKGMLFDEGFAQVVSEGVRLNVTADVLGLVVSALQQIAMLHLDSNTTAVRALHIVPNVPVHLVTAFWILADTLKITPYFAHTCANCSPSRTGGPIQICPKRAG